MVVVLLVCWMVYCVAGVLCCWCVVGVLCSWRVVGVLCCRKKLDHAGDG